MNMETWRCKKCGDCCKNQKIKLEIDEKELVYFPKKFFRPFIGVGKTKSEIKTILYKLISKRCPMYDDEIGCTIYENRPILCKRFPVYEKGFDNHCKHVSTKIGSYLAVPKEYLEYVKQASQLQNILCQEILKLGVENTWLYENHKWTRFNPNKKSHMRSNLF